MQLDIGSNLSARRIRVDKMLSPAEQWRVSRTSMANQAIFEVEVLEPLFRVISHRRARSR